MLRRYQIFLVLERGLMLVESLFRATTQWQGFKVVVVRGDRTGLLAEAATDRGYRPRYHRCGERGIVPGQPWGSVVPSRAAVGYPDTGKLLAAPRKL